MDRRNFLRAATIPAAAAMATPVVAQEGAGETVTVAVGPGGALVYEPGTDAPLEVLPGTTVEFVWESDNHNIVVESQPEAANWEGHEPLENTGFTYEHTFETLGTYEYYCEPHRSAGMVATIEVVEEITTPAPATKPQVPETALTLGVATAFAMVTTLGLGFFFMKYGGDYGVDDE
ncbi:UNVERIFIED_CONTAM: halocyanin [Euhalothece sp. KZN 001]